jgi:hypothetical protein
MNPLEVAVAYAARGWPVFPASWDGRKHPLVKWGEVAITDPVQIADWWRRWPRALIGMPTGRRSGIVVVDVDIKDPAAYGPDTLAYALDCAVLPTTPIAHTASGGFHIYFAVNPRVEIRNSAGEKELGRGLDVRGQGGYVVLPSPGSGYSWDPHWNFDTVAPVMAPAWLGHRQRPERADRHGRRLDPQAILAEACRRIRQAGPGDRHDTINREAFSVAALVAAGVLDRADAWHQAAAATLALVASTGGDLKKAERDLADAFKDGLAAAPRRTRR